MATYKPYKKTTDGKEEIKIPYSVLSNPPAIPTSIDGLGGGTLTSPIKLTGGDGAAASKMILTSNGQITDTSTSTLFGFSGGNLIVGHGNYPLTMRGKQARPTWNGKDLALKSDIPSKTSQLTNDSGFTANKGTVTSVGIKMNDVVKGTVTEAGVVDLGTVITQHQNLPIKSASLSGTTLYLTL